MRAAVIGIGSNSVRMLVAEAADGEIRRISRDRAGTRLFAGLDEAGNLSREAMASSCAAVKRMADSARSQGAEKVHLFATSATRDAANNADFAALLKAETGLTLEICSGDEEAALSFFGATDGGDSGVIDIGGGSTEIIIGPGRNIRCSFSCDCSSGFRFATTAIWTRWSRLPLIFWQTSCWITLCCRCRAAGAARAAHSRRLPRW